MEAEAGGARAEHTIFPDARRSLLFLDKELGKDYNGRDLKAEKGPQEENKKRGKRLGSEGLEKSYGYGKGGEERC